MTQSRLHLFEGIGLELEYMLVDEQSLNVAPAADALLADFAGELASDCDLGTFWISNELVNHVIELKLGLPAKSLDGLATIAQQTVLRVNEKLARHQLRLLPTAAHPWLDPQTETQLWPHAGREIYEAFDRIFQCQGHGWSNLQSTHLNLPFANDDEFGRLHAAIRLALPLLPALAASSPILDGKPTGKQDARLDVYRRNCQRIPSIAGEVIPEPVYTEDEYRTQIFRRMYRDIAPLDPQGVLQHEFLNARGAIARFERGAIEIRVLDVQECPLADCAIAAGIVALLQSLVEERWSCIADQQAQPSRPLVELLHRAIQSADRAVIDDRAYLTHFGLTSTHKCSMRELWDRLLFGCRLIDRIADPLLQTTLEQIVRQRGVLSRQILDDLPESPSRADLQCVYRQLADSLRDGQLFNR